MLQIIICHMDTFVTIYSCHGMQCPKYLKVVQIQTGFDCIIIMINYRNVAFVKANINSESRSTHFCL